METAPVQSANRQIARAAGTVIVAFLVTQLTGLVGSVLVYRTFGTSVSLDSYNAANRVTEILFNLMAGGALGSAFIPTFTALLAKEQRERAWKLASGIASLLFLVLGLVAVVAAVFAPQIVRHVLFVLAPDQAPGQEDLTIQLLRLLLPTVIIFGLSGLVMGILNAHQRFLLPALAPAMYSLGQITGVLLFPHSLGILRLALGNLLGASLHLLVQLPDLLRLKGKLTPMLGLHMPEVRQVIILMGPRVLGVAVVQINFIVNTVIALSLPAGSVSAIVLAFTWMMMPQAAIAQSIAIAALPTFSAQAAAGKLDELRASLSASLRGVLLLAIPAALGLILLRVPLFRLLYQHGDEFTAHSTDMVAWALMWYAFGLVSHSLIEIIVRAFYAMHDTRTPVGVGVLAMAMNVAFSLTLPGVFSSWGWMPHGGLALANALATTMEMLALLLLIRRRLHGLNMRLLLAGAGQALLGALVMGALVWGWLALVAGNSAMAVIGGALVGATTYGLVALAQGLPEARQVLGIAIRRVRAFVAR